MTTDQIAEVLFTSTRTCRNRLVALRSIGFLDSFIPVRPGRGLPLYWLSGPLSARYVALANGDRPPTAKALRERQDRLVAASAHLAHITGTNQFFVDLLAVARRTPGARLARWWPTPTIAAACGRRVHPDGHGVWWQDGEQLAWFAEHDTGSETLAVLAGKLPAYRRLREAGGPDWPILILLPGPARETHLHQHLAVVGRLGVTVATSTHDEAHADPAGPIWRLVGNGRRRHRLIDLPGQVGGTGPFHPGPPTVGQEPLFLLGPTGARNSS